jgi:hypothetical protein
MLGTVLEMVDRLCRIGQSSYSIKDRRWEEIKEGSVNSQL